MTIEEAKSFLQINFTGPNASLDDDLVGDLIAAAREDCEFRTGCSFITQGWRLDVGPCGPPPTCGFDPSIRLPKPPLIAVQSIVSQGSTLNPDHYRVSPGTPGRIAPVGSHWGPMVIEYTAGFGTEPSDVPQTIRQAIKHLAAFMYMNRGDDAQPPAVIDRLLSRWKRPINA